MSGALDVLYCDNHLLVVAKPAGMPTVPDASGDPSALELAREWVRTEFTKPGAAFLGVVHRLDRPVSGVLVLARTSKAAARLSAQWRARSAHKIYWAVGERRAAAAKRAVRARAVKRAVSARETASTRASAPRGERAGIVDHWLAKDKRSNRVRVVPPNTHRARRAITSWRVLETATGRTLYELAPATGRSHQLRACAAALGTPLVGDVKYGARVPLADRSIALHARELELEHPTRRETMCFRAPPPRSAVWDFETCRRAR
jgi:23S rRNA pseudouridine1911/1915/1917 synthase